LFFSCIFATPACFIPETLNYLFFGSGTDLYFWLSFLPAIVSPLSSTFSSFPYLIVLNSPFDAVLFLLDGNVEVNPANWYKTAPGGGEIGC
jgi:hypothetical protein